MFFLNDTATTEIYTLALHDALPIWPGHGDAARLEYPHVPARPPALPEAALDPAPAQVHRQLVAGDRKSTRLNSSHANISSAVFCLKKNNTTFRNMLPPHFYAHGK